VRDDSLEEGFARGDAAAYEAAYRLFGSRMLAAALRVVRDRGIAGECVHDVFLSLWRKRRAYDASRGSLEAFLVVCVRNRALTQVRAGAREHKVAQAADLPDTYTLEEDPIERERIARALSRLSEAQAAVVQRAYFRAMTLREVADDLAIPIGTVKGRLSDALRNLRRTLIPETADGA
jgi:RNA polymerase sigma-70 factor (ECF subfamily)